MYAHLSPSQYSGRGEGFVVRGLEISSQLYSIVDTLVMSVGHGIVYYSIVRWSDTLIILKYKNN